MNQTTLICKSEYVTMRDGIRLAVSIWLPSDLRGKGGKFPAILTTTRYWRATALLEDKLEIQTYYPFAYYLSSRDYILVTVDARGSGASFGCRDAEYSPAEVDDIGEIIEWIARQAWCDGRVATEGTSYTAQTALCSLVTASSALKIAVCRAPDFDMYRHVFAPGGIANHWMIEAWGGATKAQDNNDVKALFDGGYWPRPKNAADIPLGVRPVDADGDGSLLLEAIAEHKRNFNVADMGDKWMFVDTNPLGNHHFLFEPVYQQRFEKSAIPAVILCGWHDAGTALGALSLFASFDCSVRVILGPYNHSGNITVDPLMQNEETEYDVMASEVLFSLPVKFCNMVFEQRKSSEKVDNKRFGCVKYYTLGENCWKTTRRWPLPETVRKRFYFGENHELSLYKPLSAEGFDRYQVDLSATTGINNRWHAQAASKPVYFPNRQEEDEKLLVYDTPPIQSDTEITGHPVVHLFVRSSATDGQFIAYLETIDPDGRVRMLTEGQLRGLHRKVSDEAPPYRMFGPYHSLKEKDALPLVPGEVAEIAFDLFPISVLLKKGQRIRVAIAGADASVFAPIVGCESPEITVERNSVYASCIDLPIIA